MFFLGSFYASEVKFELYRRRGRRNSYLAYSLTSGAGVTCASSMMDDRHQEDGFEMAGIPKNYCTYPKGFCTSQISSVHKTFLDSLAI